MLATGQPWPPDGDRIAGYRDFGALYDGRHIDVDSISRAHDRRRRELGPDADTYLVHDFPRLIVNIPTNLLISSPPVISYPTELNEETGEQIESAEGEALRDILKRSKFQKVLLELVQDTGALGDGVLVVTGSVESVKIEAKPAYCYFPEVNPDNAKEALSECLAWAREWEGKTVIRVDRYEIGKIVREAYRLNGSKVGEQIPAQEVEIMIGGPVEVASGVTDVNTIIHVPNNPSSSCYFGRSDLSGGLLSLFDEANERASQVARILDKHSDPKMAGPKLHLDSEGQLRLMNYFETVDGTAPQYITWDAQLQAAFSHMDRVKENIFAFAEVAEALAYLVQGARYDSAPAAKMQFAQTLAKTARKRLYLDYALKEAIQIAVAIYLGQSYEETPEPNIRWRDGLPKDLSQDAITEEVRLRSGTTNQVDAIRRLDDCDESTARANIAEQEKLGGSPPQQETDPAPIEEPPTEAAFSLAGSEEVA